MTEEELQAAYLAVVLAQPEDRQAILDYIEGSLSEETDDVKAKYQSKAMSAYNETSGGALVPPPRFPRPKKSTKALRLKYKGSYFQDCERDDEGHCLPQGEANGSSGESETSREEKEVVAKHGTKIKRIGSKIYHALFNVSAQAGQYLNDVFDSAEEFARAQLAKSNDVVQANLGISGNTAMLILSHSLAYALTKLKGKKEKGMNTDDFAMLVAIVLKAAFEEMGLKNFIPTAADIRASMDNAPTVERL